MKTSVRENLDCNLTPSHSDNTIGSPNFKMSYTIAKKKVNFGKVIKTNRTLKSQKTSKSIKSEKNTIKPITESNTIQNSKSNTFISRSSSFDNESSDILESSENVDLIENLAKESIYKPIIKSASQKSLKTKSKFPKRNLNWLISTFYLVKKFIKRLRRYSSIIPVWMGSNHLDYIHDVTYYHTGEYKKSFNNKLLNAFRQKIILFPTFCPNNNFSIIWNIIVNILIIINFFRITLNFSFEAEILDSVENDSNFNIIMILKYITAIIFGLDFFVLMNTQYYEKGSLINERKKIIVNFFKKDFFFTILGFIPLVIELFSNLPKFYSLIFLIKLISLKKFITTMDEILEIEESWQNKLSLIKLIIGILFITHIFACIWHLVGLLDPIDNWIVNYGIHNSGWQIRYLYSIYFVCVSMNTVGYGDVVPHTHLERLFSVVFIYIACFIFAYSVNSIGIILQNLNKKNSELKRKLNVINNLMRRKNINAELRIRIRKYLNFVLEEEKQHNETEEAEVLAKLTDSLAEELSFEANAAIIKKMPMLFMNFSEAFLVKVVQKIKEVRLTPNELLFRQGDANDKSLYIIKSGEIQLYYENENNKESEIKTLKKEEVFGQLAFFADNPRLCSAKSPKFTTLNYLNQSEFLEVIKLYPQDYEIYCQMKDKANLNSSYADLFTNCLVCKESDHFINKCSYLHFIPNKQGIISKLTFSHFQKRKLHKRNEKKSPSPWEVYKKYNNVDYFLAHLKKMESISNELKPMNSMDASLTTFSFEDPNLTLKDICEDEPHFARSNKRSMAIFRTQLESNDNEKNSLIIKDEEKTIYNSNQSNNAISANSHTIEEKKENSKTNIEINFFEEKLKEYKKYFPHNNSENVIEKINMILDDKIDKRGKIRRKVNLKNLNQLNNLSNSAIKKRNYENFKPHRSLKVKGSVFVKIREDKKAYGKISGIELFKFLKSNKNEKKGVLDKIKKQLTRILK